MNVKKSVSAKIYFGTLIYHILVYIKLIMYFVLQYGSTITKDISNDHIACLPESLKKALKNSSHKAIFWNDSGDRKYVKIEDPTKFVWKWNDSSYVRLPFSSLNRSLLGHSSPNLRWQSINEKLKKLEFVTKIAESKEPNFTGKQLAHHLAGWSTSDEYNYGILKSNSDLNDMLKKTLQFIILEAKQLPHRLSSPVPILKQKSNDVIYLNRRLASSLLANMFLCTFPLQGFARELPSVNFVGLFHIDENPMKTRVKIEKLKCILTYFISLMDGTNKIPNSIISFERRYNTRRFDWSSCHVTLCVLKVLQGRIEDSKGMLQVDFANRVIGGGVLNSGAVQEEIMFSVSPELICARVFCEPMNDNEVIVITGTRKFSFYCGYASTFTYGGIEMHHDIPLDNLDRERNQIVAMDALNFSKVDKESQYTKAKIDRELHKCYLAFQANNLITPVATGNWGCGVFNGDPELKFMIQWIAASAQKRPLFQFYASDKHQSVNFFEVPNLLVKEGKRVREVYDMLISYGKQRKDNSMYWLWERDFSLFDYMRAKLKSSKVSLSARHNRNSHTPIF